MAEESNSLQLYCQKCKKTLSATEFYGSYNLEKYPNGKLKECKKCITMHVDNWNPDSYLWILQECDVPYIPKEWFKLMEKYAKDPKSVTGASIIGRYLAKMRLNQHKKYRWKDTEFLQKLEANKIEQTLTAEGYDIADVTLAVQQSNALLPDISNIEQFVPEIKHLDSEATMNVVGGPPPRPEYAPPIDDYFSQQPAGNENYFNNDLTEEDKTYLRIKWGNTYRPDEWVKLEDLYKQMTESYDIQGAAHFDTLKLICKTSLKANQLIDLGDVEGFQKMSKVYDTLMKSGKFTANQIKAEGGDAVDSIGEIVAMCEKEGFIPRYYTDGPQDKVDKVLLDLQSYTHHLIDEETNLGQMLEHAINQIAQDKEKENRDDFDDDEDADLEEELFAEDSKKLIQDIDYAAFSDFEDSLEDMDNDFLKDILESGELDWH